MGRSVNRRRHIEIRDLQNAVAELEELLQGRSR
jgi:hypothetical protein